jgi:two-component system, chemotaxis family, CheB/CheR fusion protein
VPEPSPGQWAHEVLLQRHAPPYLVVDEHFDVLEFSTGLAPFLDPAGGAASLNVFGLIHEQLRTDLRTALQKARSGRATATQPAVRVDRNGHRRLVDLVAEPRVLDGREVGQFVVILKDHPVATDAVEPPRDGAAEDAAAVERLEDDLRAARERLETTIEQLETSNEELASSNEELLSMNEELQSSNEELEASQEELQSLNEELETINTQLADKVEELDRAQEDLVNLLDATLFLTAELRIKRFTPGLADVIALQPGDEGRFLGDFALKFEHPSLLGDVRGVIRDGIHRQVEVTRREDGHVFLLRITPYHTSHDLIDGAVLTFVDISHIKAVERQLRTYQRRAEVAIAASGAGLYEHSVPPGADTYYNDRWTEILGLAPADLPEPPDFLDWLFERILPEDRAFMEQAYDAINRGETDRYDVQVRLRHQDGRWIWVRGVAQLLERDQMGRVARIAGLILDVSKEREASDALERTAERLRMALDAGGMGIWDSDPEHGTVAWDERTHELLGLDRAETQPGLERFFAAVHPEDRDELQHVIDAAIASGERYSAEFRVVLPGGRIRRLGLHGRVQRDRDGRAVGIIGVSFLRTNEPRTANGAARAGIILPGATVRPSGDGSAS